MKIAVVYATDFADIAPGGVQAFVRQMGEHVPPEHRITYYCVGAALPPRLQDSARQVVSDIDSNLPLNLRFSIALFKFRREIKGFDRVVVHRPEYVVPLALGTHITTVLHGATLNAWKTGRRLFGLLHVLTEILALCRSRKILSVDRQGFIGARYLKLGKLEQIRVPAHDSFAQVSTSVAMARPTLVTAARLVPEKRIDRIVDLAVFADTDVVIFGDGPLRASLEAYAEQRGCRARFMGHVSPTALAAFYSSSAACFVLTSTFEGYPLAAVEAASAGVPLMGVQSRALEKLERYRILSNVSSEVARAALRDEAGDSWVLQDLAGIRRDHMQVHVAREFWAGIT